MLMETVSWNVQALGCKKKRRVIKDLLCKAELDRKKKEKEKEKKKKRKV